MTLNELFTGLKPCPFCGGEAYMTRYQEMTVVRCKGCRARLNVFGNKECAEDAWNRRFVK